ncbi:MAG: uroporphyrinogen decarboxylase [Betaproteobacteria bacterium]|nr:uroporphyrinogen decarboxylase [Betaproteobacteria bacterium]
MDHFERIEAAIAGGVTDQVPVALWKHFPVDDQDPAKLAANTVAWQRKYDFDLVKFMPSGTYSVEDWGAKSAYDGAPNGARKIVQAGVASPSDWLGLRRLDPASGVLGAQNAALGSTARELAGSVPILQTLFSPLTTARKLAGDVVFDHLRNHSNALEAGLRTITDTTIDFALAALAAGAHGFFLATQCATTDDMTEAEYARFGVRFDLEILAAVKAKARYNMLHVHGQNVMFGMMAGYPVEMINWHDRLTPPSLAQALPRFSGALVGGVAERDLLVTGTAGEVHAQVRDAIVQTGGKQLIVGPGCVVAIAAPEANLRAAVDAARGQKTD